MAKKCPKCQSDNPGTATFCADCGTQLPSLEDVEVTETMEAPKEELTTGSTFASRYQIIEELGKGGMGRVYKAHDTKIKEKIALKLIKPEIAKDKKTIERFSNELRLARKIRHKNVCGMFDLGEEKGTHYITMEFVPGEDLRSSIRRFGQLPIAKSISIAKQICEGLAEAHRLGVVHRDLKSNNIMIDKEGNVRIMDFGIARSLEAKGITGTGVMIGTPEYMSPEQVEGKEADQRSDIYSLGVILYEMVTGRVPFEGDTPFTIGMKHKGEIPKDPKELNTQIPEDLSHAILRCLEKDKEKRYQSAGEVRSELTNIEKGIPTTERIVSERKPITSREITVTFGLKKLWIPAVAVILMAIIAIAVWQLLPERKTVPIPSDKPSLAIMYFKNNTGDEKLDHWRTMLADLLIKDLTQSKYIRILSEDKLVNILEEQNQLEAKSYSTKVLKEVATQGRVTNILQGNYAKAGDAFRVNVTLQDASTMEIIGSEGVEGIGEESIFSMVDELTKKIKTRFKLTEEKIATDIDKHIGEITTSSPEAYKFYREGVKHGDRGDYRREIQCYEKAIAIDPEFAKAYLDMGIAYYNLRLFSEEKKYIKKALELSDRVSDRERYLAEAYFYTTSEKTFDKAIEAFKKLLEFYPEDEQGNADLGWVYMQLEQWDEAIKRYEVLVQNNVETMNVYTNLASLYRAKELYDKAKFVLESFINNFSDNVGIHQSLARNYIYQGKLDLALAETDKAFLLDPTHYENFMMKGDICLYRGDLIEAEKEYQDLLNAREPVARAWHLSRLTDLYELQGRFEKSKILYKQGIELSKKVGQNLWISLFHQALASLYLTSGNPEDALKESDEALQSAVDAEYQAGQRNALMIKCASYLEMNSIGKALQVAEELKGMIEEGMNKKRMRSYFYLVGEIELKKENFSKAIEYLKKALSLTSYGPLTKNASYINSLAIAYYNSGDIENARKEYERITGLTTGRLGYGPIFAKSFYMLGKIHEKRGDSAKAIEQYQKFLDLWKDADSGIAEVKDARKRLAGLKGPDVAS